MPFDARGAATTSAGAAALGLAGQQFIHREHHANAMAEQTLELYRRVTSAPLT